MIRNQRPYQLVFSKTHCAPIALLSAVVAKTVGVSFGKVTSLFGKECVHFENIDSVKSEIKEIYDKPPVDGKILTLQKANEEIDLTVIVPTYNAEKYIDKCMESIVNQKTKYNFEIVVVNDNSTDSTLFRLEKFTNFEKIRIVDFKYGGTAAKTRNKGIVHSVGKYIMFVDSDDYLSLDAIDKLMDAAKKTSADVVQGGWQYIDENGNLGLSQKYVNTVYEGKKFVDRFDLPGMPWGKVYKRELFENIRFPSEYTCFEDTIVHFLIFRQAKKVASIGDNIYFWRKNPNGITKTSQNENKAMQSYWIVEDMIEKSKNIGLECDDTFAMCVITQLSNFCYVNVAKMDVDIQKKIFALCCDLYEKTLSDFDYKRLPYAVKLGARALKEKRFDLWKKQGKLYSLVR